MIENEKTKLTANWLNALASGVITTGAIAPFVAVIFGATTVPAWVVIVSAAVWLGAGLAYIF